MVNKAHTSNKNLKCNVTCKHYSNRIAYQCLLVFLGTITVHMFCKIFINKEHSPEAHLIPFDSALFSFLFDTQIF